jgi:hypothetical protein
LSQTQQVSIFAILFHNQLSKQVHASMSRFTNQLASFKDCWTFQLEEFFKRCQLLFSSSKFSVLQHTFLPLVS